MTDGFLATPELRLHYIEHPGDDPPIVALHGLSSNAHVFDAIGPLLAPRRVLSLDLRGRGLSDKPASGYGMEDHARDVLALLDARGLEKADVCGHSFGGLLAYWLAARHPTRVARLVVIDAAHAFHPRTAELLAPSLGRLGKHFPSWTAYLDAVKATPHFDGFVFDEAAIAHSRADVEDLADGTVAPRSPVSAIEQAGRSLGTEPWREILAAVGQPTLVLNATGGYGLPGTPPLLPRELAEEASRLVADGRYVAIPGNHMTMMFGEGAPAIAAAIGEFLRR